MEKEFCFVRVSFPFNFTKDSDSVVPMGHSSISVEIAYGNNNPLPGNGKKQEIIKIVMADLKKANLLKDDDEIVYLDTYDIKYGYVIYDKNRRPAIKEVHEFVKKYDIIPTGRYGLWAYLWSDEAMMSGKLSSEKLIP